MKARVLIIIVGLSIAGITGFGIYSTYSQSNFIESYSPEYPSISNIPLYEGDSTPSNIPEYQNDASITLIRHTAEDQEQIELWEKCRFGNHAMILEKFPAVCILDNENRYEQPVFYANKPQWEACNALENSIILDEDTKCIAPNEVVYYMKN